MKAAHGTRERYEASPDGCCDGCRLMMVIWTKHDAVPIRQPARPGLVDAAPFGLLLRALIREGYSIRELADRTHISGTELRHISLDFFSGVFPSTAAVLRSLTVLLPSEREVTPLDASA